MVQSVVTVMRQTPEVDVLTLGVSSLSSDAWHSTGVGWNHFCSQPERVGTGLTKIPQTKVLHGAGQRGLLGPEALAFCGAGQLQAAPAQVGCRSFKTNHSNHRQTSSCSIESRRIW